MTADEKNNLVYKRKTLLPSTTQVPATSMILRSRQKSAGATSSVRNQINISEDVSAKFEPEECQSTTDDFIHYSFQANFSKLVQNADHPTVKNALDPSNPFYSNWVEATKKEIFGGLLSGDVPCLQPTAKENIGKDGRKFRIFRSAVRYTIKRNSADPTQVDKFKCRLTCDSSVLRDVPIESFSLTISTVTLAVCQNISMIDNHEEILVDTVAAFIQQLYPCGPNDTELYLTFDDRISKVCGLPCGQLYRICRYIYGLPDSGKAYYLAYASLLEKEGYIKTNMILVSSFDGRIQEARQYSRSYTSWKRAYFKLIVSCVSINCNRC